MEDGTFMWGSCEGADGPSMMGVSIGDEYSPASAMAYTYASLFYLFE